MISVTVPVYNEAEALPILAERVTTVLTQVGQPWELIFINDGSHDGSEAVLDGLAKANPAIKVVHFRRNYGQTAAMMAGFDFAAGDVIIPMDGDLQNDPSDIPKLLAKLDEGFDVCSGWRKDRQDNALQRNLPSIMANRLISAVSGVELHDFGCSLKAYRAEVIKSVRLYGEMHRFLPIYAYWHGAKITEVTVNHFARTTGQSKYGLERVLKVLADLLVVKFLDSYAEKPMYVFGAVGLLSFFVSIAAGGSALYLKLFGHKSFIETPLPLLCVMSALTGIMCFLMGLLAEMIMRTFYESQGKSVYAVRATRNMEQKELTMCGIAGFVGTGDRGVLQRMTDAIRYRGPDAEGHWVEEDAGVYLGHRRLAIVDLSGGAQPMWTADGAIGVVFNGEIYNHVELRAELKAAGCEFVTDHSDTEVLLHGYRQWGDSFVERLNGFWAFVIYDRSRKRLFGSRDRFGKKPFYYFHEGGTFGWGSELPALLAHPQCPRDLSPLALKKYFAYGYIPAPRSIYERVWKLPGGHSFFYDLASRELKTWRYWEFVLQPTPMVGIEDDGGWQVAQTDGGRPNEREINQLCEEIRATLERAVQRRLMSDVPLGVFLSGGIDSSAIAALAAKHVPVGQLNTFSIGFNEPSFDESAHARFVAERLGTKHREEILDLDKSVALLPEIVSKLDEPLGDGSLLPTYLLSRFTRQHVTVALGGDGGDELFAGYDPFRALQKAELYSKLVPHPVHEAIRLVAARLPVSHQNLSLDFKIKRTLMGLSYPPPLWNAVWMSALEPRELAQLFREPCDEEEVYSEAIEAWDRCQQPNLIDRALQFWTNLYLQDGIMAKVDRASMMNSLEARSPFLDIEFVDLARRIPWQLKLHGGATKWILKKALAPLLPAEIIDRPKKGFGMPIGRWLREGRFEFDHARTFPHLDVAFAERKHAAHMSGKADERLFLWSYWLLSQWMKK